ncbi:nucleic acid/nucleotide deaminase domain-containing protein [Streptomyces sp. NPDC017056]|uniref:nucleic acid/nucleotide deaminase domain-containing protein n=1 Tax=Streptomyces sp. NPDC017056 TaxID=3364973 RepID=UPI00378CE307
MLDDITDTASTEWFAAFEVVNVRGEKQIFTEPGSVGIHPEEKLWRKLRQAGVEPERVLRIHTELEACFMPSHYCSLWLGEVFPDAQFTYNFPYGESADSRAESIQQLRVAAAEQPPQ